MINLQINPKNPPGNIKQNKVNKHDTQKLLLLKSTNNESSQELITSNFKQILYEFINFITSRTLILQQINRWTIPSTKTYTILSFESW